ncbi:MULTISPECIES: SDR family oxidoreductase [unclassified Rhizobium]|uniref:SDR family oxidoreductase n=1 Tax=unclassified Rhizobium TaxID=2613769 RepID=UPI00160968A4|nr:MULTISPECIES: SDR family oxidoreductase [unclassified Rhizobium]MBB3386179.1 NAD(P)-dependent dehydrogenase (short-subunit alcohol dehydrogenase family) [Rhizobium sp. BK098]MBB3571155.1 NAD(P)-dependent dehydrogenase (short-subunit alcohol dehydrogenase family) [Rhizobium sp. BK491]MBB3617883.1 NAD(P)-dependent dehydrogenase (short-subunit alcohol dehydrogenase family) [Rhizobium sp. BK609]MBB3683664.1 NAD(P)-dependent dehydrogenase (short-subunit alcohol dehydrogenase family) [Rhizobium sp
MVRLKGKRAFITGAAQGIGLAIAEAFVREAAAVFLIDMDGDLLAAVARRLQAQGAIVGHMTADITDARAISEAVAQAEREIGRINALVNNAGVNVFAEPLETSDEEWNRCFDINLKGAWNCSKAILPGLIGEGGGAILNIASTHAFTIIPHTFPYPLAKHALLGMTKSLGLEYASKNVRVNALAPGYVATQKVIDYWNGFADPEAAKAETMKLHPGGRIAMPQEIAMAAVFMISDECPFINATCLTVDGGLSVQQHPA